MEVEQFLRVAAGVTSAIAELHRRDLVHGNLAPQLILTDPLTGASAVKGAAGRGGAPASLAAVRRRDDALAYIAPEQSGRMNRPVDSRSDLYSVGVIFYELLTGAPPFRAQDALEWVHCHIARLPRSPAEVVPSIPAVLAGIVMKLLAKTAEDRYQTAAGLRADLDACLAQWHAGRGLHPFALGAGDIPDSLLIPQALYGRERDLETLRRAFARVIDPGGAELVAIAGYSGIGKTSLVRELHKIVVRDHGLFVSGKFDQYRRNVPYATLVEAFRDLIQQILSASEARIAGWRRDLVTALGVNARLVVDMIPQLALIVGEPPPVPDLPLSEAEHRFGMVFQQFVGVFARREHPLVLFLDDLQWADVGSLKLLERILTDADTRHLLVLGAYRDNEVTAPHPLLSTLDALRAGPASPATITLGALSAGDVTRLLADTLRTDTARVEPLSRLVFDKTAGNPFFAIQFLLALHRERLLEFDRDARAWQWDLDRIREKGYSDNVVDLMVRKLVTLPAPTQQALRLAACIGNRFDPATLPSISALTEDEAERAVQDGMRDGLLLGAADGTASFLHDRVQQAAYSLIPEDERPAVHLGIGRLLLARSTPAEIEERLFDLVGQFALGAALLTDPVERHRVARLHLAAGTKAKASTAYASALSHLAAGARLLAADAWRTDYELAYALHREMAEVEYLSSNYARSKELIDLVVANARSTLDRAQLYNILIVQYTLLARYRDAIETGREALRLLGVHVPDRDFRAAFEAELITYRRLLRGRPLATLADDPELVDPERRVALELLSNMVVPARYTDSALFGLVSILNVNFSLEFGPTAKSTVGYSAFGMVLNAAMNEYREAYELGDLALRIATRFADLAQKCQACFMLGHYLSPWVQHLEAADDFLEAGYRDGLASGEMQWTGYTLAYKPFQPFYRGVRIQQVQEQLPNLLAFTQKTRNRWATDTLLGVQLALSTLRGRQLDLVSDARRDDVLGHVGDGEFIASCRENRSFGGLGRYLVLKAQLAYLFGRFGEALEDVLAARELQGFFSSSISVAQLNLFHSLTLAALHAGAPPGARLEHERQIEANQAQMATWARHCGDNFEHLHLLVSAELARVRGSEAEAERLYEQALAAARKRGFVQDEGLTDEVAARFHEARGLRTVARAYLREARACYARWGADLKVKQLDRDHAWLVADERGAPRPGGTPIGHLDVISVLKASQAVSGEIVLSRLVDTLMRTALESAGAQRGCLLVARGDVLSVEAEALVAGTQIAVLQPGPEPLAAELPASVLNFVRRTHQTVMLEDASEQHTFSSDPYFGRRGALSLLCLPLLRQANLIGMLYLENALLRGAFSAERMAVLEVLAAQAAISLENAALYLERSRAEEALRASEAKYRTLVNNVNIGVFRSSATSGRLFQANPALAKMFGYASTDDVRDMDVTALYQDPADRRWFLDALARDGFVKDRDVGMRKKDGTPMWCAITATAHLDASGRMDWVDGVVEDITERKQLEEQLRHSQKMEAIGTLAGGVAHDFNNILTAITGFTSLVGMRVANDPELTADVESILQAAQRGAKLTGSLLAFSRKQMITPRPVNLNEIVSQVDGLLRRIIGEDVDLAVAVAPAPLPILADPSQIEQVLMNLAANARDAMPSGGALRVTTRRLAAPPAGALPGSTQLGCALLSVSDTGRGMDEATKQRIFEPFFTTKQVGKGTGLGLSMVYGIVKQHGGEIRVASEPARGTTFEIYFPVTAAEVVAPARKPVGMPTGGHETILIAEDDAAVRSYMKRLLEEFGYAVIAAVDGEDAVRKFAENQERVQLVILDAIMPRMNGREARDRIVELRPGTRVLYASGYTGEIIRREGGVDFIAKPVAPEVLLSKVRELLSR